MSSAESRYEQRIHLIKNLPYYKNIFIYQDTDSRTLVDYEVTYSHISKITNAYNFAINYNMKTMHIIENLFQSNLIN